MPGTGKEKSDKTGDKDLRKSERINKGDGSGEKVDLSLPPPLQLKDRGAAAATTTSTPRKESMLDEEARLDKDIGEMEKSIHEAEKQLGEMVQKQRLQGKKDKLERLRQDQDQDQDNLLVKRRNDNHSPGPVIRELVLSSHQRNELRYTILCIFSG